MRSAAGRRGIKLSLLLDRTVLKLHLAHHCVFFPGAHHTNSPFSPFSCLYVNFAGDACVEVIDKCSCTSSCYRASSMEHVYDFAPPLDDETSADSPAIKANNWKQKMQWLRMRQMQISRFPGGRCRQVRRRVQHLASQGALRSQVLAKHHFIFKLAMITKFRSIETL